MVQSFVEPVDSLPDTPIDPGTGQSSSVMKSMTDDEISELTQAECDISDVYPCGVCGDIYVDDPETQSRFSVGCDGCG